MLAKAWRVLGKKVAFSDLNPKAVTNSELYGFSHPQTREWQNGLFSTIMKDMAEQPNKDPKWIILDGDIDPVRRCSRIPVQKPDLGPRADRTGSSRSTQ
jgi:dynein heavy chain